MYCQNSIELEELVNRAKPFATDGKVADYIPALGKAHAGDLSIAIHYIDGSCYSAGDIKKTFTLQSISKVLSLALAIMDRGEEEVFSKVGMEPTGDPFNSIAKLETSVPSKPLNPMINAGALAVTNMINGATTEEKFKRFLVFVQKLTGNSEISYSEEVAQSEFETASLNRSLAYFLKAHGVISGDVEDIIDLYTKQCAVEINCHDLAQIGMVLANGGRGPQSGDDIIPARIARLVKTFMATCGMYNASGEFAIKVGIPSKSGVSGGILSSYPGLLGIGIYGPALDPKGNSIAGIHLMELLSQRYELSIF